MPKKIISLLQEPNLKDAPKELPYPTLLKELSCEAMQRKPIFDYRNMTPAQVRARLAEVRRLLRKCLHLPARMGRCTRIVTQPPVQYDGYSIQPVALERGAGWWITAHLYLPDGLARPAPAVMHVHGHANGKSEPGYARRCRGLARRGFVSLFVDFPNASERVGTGHALWYLNMVNLPLQRIMVEDNIAAFTYLASLPCVDGNRIGVMGSSGGGNQTAFFSALEERIAAAAPTNAPTMLSEHAASGGGAYCHCEVIPSLLDAGLEYHDLLAAMAPKPLCVFAGIRDPLFPIIGARKAVEEASYAYQALGAGENCALEEHYCGHFVPDDMRIGTYRFFEGALKRPGDLSGSEDEGEDIDLTDPRLRALPRRPARVITVPDLYRAQLTRAKPAGISRATLNKHLGRKTSDAEVWGLTAFTAREWARIVLATRDGGILPMAIRGAGSGEITLFVADGGKEEALKHAGANSGRIAVFDWRGQGETAPPDIWWQQRAAHYLAFAGKSLPGGRVTDILAVARWLRQQDYEITKVVALGGEASLLTLLAASVDSSFPKIELHGLLKTFREVPGLTKQISFTAWVPGLALKTDIPQLLKALRGRVTVQSWLQPGADALREAAAE